MPKVYRLPVFVILGASIASAAVDFNREIRPLLSDNCFQCHGPDEKRRMAGLRLDTKEGAFGQTKNGQLIVPGDPAKSPLLQRMAHAEKARRMPPPTSGRDVSEKQIDTVRRWIQEGAKWETHWAFNAPKRPDLPAVKNTGAIHNPIDNFIQARLEREGLTPAPEADRRTLLRRLSFDLTGLPPSLKDVEAFVQDKSPDAYEKQVNRLLASPHHGERMAMDWLDVARYADTHGYHIDSHRDMWPWRDWLIKAFNSNMPFDKFTTLQLAGDLAPDAGVEGKIASGFNRNHMINFEGGAIPEEYLVEYVADRAETTAGAWMGLTVGCARCHTHKYDPISHKEYYQFFAFFNNVDEKGLDGRTGNAKPLLQLPTPEQKVRDEQLEAAIKTREDALESKEVTGALAQWRATLTGKAAPIERDSLSAHYDFDGSLNDISGKYQHGRTLKGDPGFGPGQVSKAVNFDAQTLVTLGKVGSLKGSEPFTVAFWLRYGGAKQPMPIFEKIDTAQGRRGWEIWLDEPILVDIQKRAARISVRLSSQWPSSALELRTRERITQNEWSHIAVVSDGSGKASGLALYINGLPTATDVLSDRLSGPIVNDAELLIGAKEPEAKPFTGGLDDLRFYARTLSAKEIRTTAVDYPIQALLSGVGGQPSKADEKRLTDFYLRYIAAEATKQQYAELRDLREQNTRLQKEIVTTMTMNELEKPRETFVLARGDYRNQTDKVEPGTPAILPPLPKTEGRANRLTLARWLVDPAHPLTARVAVNRYWQMYFGTGLVKTTENFGSQGEPPSHPELLDWLATEFVRTGWDVKAMQRLIVTSAAYRRASPVTPELLEKDPENRLLARGPRYRLPAEMVRDNALAVSGLLNNDIGGKSVFPYQPAGLWEEMAFGDGFTMQTYVQSHGKDLYRRSMYTFWKRTTPPAQMVTFDAPDREKCTARRTITNTPLQALVTLNDPTYVEASRALAERVLMEAGRNPNRRAALAFQLATARQATKSEVEVLTRLAKEQTAHFRGAPKETAALLTNGESPYDKALEPADLAAWTMVASAILNLDETISKE
ncbi:MAG TPA: DUF1553 domain-containing protein [Bryobacteraceae bacterium]|nr:DUF1553 domain-containing protein [Bryobacteraceae bacterium]